MHMVGVVFGRHKTAAVALWLAASCKSGMHKVMPVFLTPKHAMSKLFKNHHG